MDEVVLKYTNPEKAYLKSIGQHLQTAFALDGVVPDAHLELASRIQAADSGREIRRALEHLRVGDADRDFVLSSELCARLAVSQLEEANSCASALLQRVCNAFGDEMHEGSRVRALADDELNAWMDCMTKNAPLPAAFSDKHAVLAGTFLLALVIANRGEILFLKKFVNAVTKDCPVIYDAALNAWLSR